MRYCFDTSAFIESWVRHYPPTAFRTLWSNIHGMIESGEIISPFDVFKDIEKQDDELFNWVKDKRSYFYELNGDLQDAVAQIMNDFPKLVDTRTNKSASDPFVIGLAMIYNIPVVTYEKGGTNIRPKIPNVCLNYKIDCWEMKDLIIAEKWIF